MTSAYVAIYDPPEYPETVIEKSSTLKDGRSWSLFIQISDH